MNNKCIYYVEGPCEQQLIAALKQNPAKLIPGKIKVLNVILHLQFAEVRLEITDTVASSQIGSAAYICATHQLIFQVKNLRQKYDLQFATVSGQQFKILF